MNWIILFILLLLPQPALAVTYWVSPSGTASSCAAADGDEDPGVIGGNTATNSPFYLSQTQLDTLNCASAGDTVMFTEFTYTESPKLLNLLVPAGTSASVRSKVLCKGNRTCIIRPTGGLPSGNHILTANNVSYYQIGARGNGFKVDCNAISVSLQCGGIRLGLTGSPAPNQTDVIIEGNEIIGNTRNGINNAEQNPTGGIYTNLVWRYNRVMEPRTPIDASGWPHAFYLAARNSTVEYNEGRTFTLAGAGTICIQAYHIASGHTIRYNYCEITDGMTGLVHSDAETGLANNSKIYGNVFKVISGTPNSCLSFHGQTDNNEYYNNVCDGFGLFMNIRAGANNNKIWNNLCTGTCSIVNNGTGNDFGGTASVTNPTVTASSNFKDATNGDYSLIAGSSQINAGLATGGIVPANGTKDRGAHETFSCTTATINTNVLDLTCSMAGNTPVQPISGATGWSVGCTGGVNCGTPVVSTVVVPTGASTILRFTLTGIGGGINACEVGQTWTITYNSATGNVRDSASIGGRTSTGSQHLQSFTNLAVTNACTGGGTPPPGGLHIHYKLDDGTSGTTPTSANDETANNLDGTLTGGATWTAGKYGSGVNLTGDSGQYIAVPYGSGVNPSTQSLTIAFGVFVNADRVSLNKSYFGAPVGTNQRLYITTRFSTWQLGIQDKSDGNPSAASDLAVTAGWNRLCLVLDSGTDTATLYLNGVASSSSSAVKTYTSYTLAGNFELGRISGVATGGGGVFDEFKVWTSVVSCADDYAAWEPNTPAWTGNIAVVSAQAWYAKLVSGVRKLYNAVNANVTIPNEGAIALLFQTDCTTTNCSAISQRLYYKCALCPSANTELPVPDTPTADGVAFYGDPSEAGLLVGDHGALLSGALTRIAGGTSHLSDSTPVFDLAQNESIVNGYIIQFRGAALGYQFCFYPKEQSGLPLNGVTPTGGLCVTVGNKTSSFSY